MLPLAVAHAFKKLKSLEVNSAFGSLVKWPIFASETHSEFSPRVRSS